MLTEKTIEQWIKRFIKELKKQIGKRYTLGGGQMRWWKKYSNIDKEGDPVGFDCCGGIIYALEVATGIEFKGTPVPGFLNKKWLIEIEEKDLTTGDLILVDIPGIKNGNLVYKDGKIYYGAYNHVMTYCPDGKNDIITTEGWGGDHRVNPKSKAKTQWWNFAAFKKVSNQYYRGATRYTYMRINWQWLLNWKKKNQVG